MTVDIALGHSVQSPGLCLLTGDASHIGSSKGFSVCAVLSRLQPILSALPVQQWAALSQDCTSKHQSLQKSLVTLSSWPAGVRQQCLNLAWAALFL